MYLTQNEQGKKVPDVECFEESQSDKDKVDGLLSGYKIGVF